MASSYGQVRSAFRDKAVWPIRQVPYRFRLDWQCGALLWPLPGDPLSRAERGLMLFTSLLCKLFFSLLFFRSGEGYTDFCDAHGTCTTFMCNLDECAVCGACGTEPAFPCLATRDRVDCMHLCDVQVAGLRWKNR